MANLVNIKQKGNQMVAYFDDGTSKMAYPTMGGIWLVKNGASGGGGGGNYSWPFNPDCITYEFRPPDRPTHDGIDFAGAPAYGGAFVPSMGDGTVWMSNESYSGYGVTVVIDHGTIDGHNVKSFYAHMRNGSRLVGVGAPVTKGQSLGKIGETGASVGEHLHWEIWIDGTGSASDKVDPRAWINAHGDGGWIYD